jgi:hypothetical protein
VVCTDVKRLHSLNLRLFAVAAESNGPIYFPFSPVNICPCHDEASHLTQKNPGARDVDDVSRAAIFQTV